MKSLFSMLSVLFIGSLWAHPASADDALKDLASLDELRNVFLKDTGKVRIVALLSPT